VSADTPWFQRFLLPVPEATGPVDGGLACCRPGLLANVDYLNWLGRRSGMDFAALDTGNGLGKPTAISTESLDFDRANAFRAGLGYRFCNGWDVLWTYTYFHVENEQTVTNNSTNFALFATQSYYSTGQSSQEPVSSITADGTLQVNIQDFDAEWSSCLNDTIGFKAFGGFRWAKIDQNFNNTYTTPAGGTGTVSLPNNMDGEGIRLGAELEWRSPIGFRVFGRAAESILVADFQTAQHENDPFVGITLNTSGSTTVVVPVIEAAVGVSYARGPWELRAGYEMSDWFNMVQLNRPAQSLFLDGYFISCSFSR
jgi:hypothetical protein